MQGLKAGIGRLGQLGRGVEMCSTPFITHKRLHALPYNERAYKGEQFVLVRQCTLSWEVLAFNFPRVREHRCLGHKRPWGINDRKRVGLWGGKEQTGGVHNVNSHGCAWHYHSAMMVPWCHISSSFSSSIRVSSSVLPWTYDIGGLHRPAR